MALQEIPISDLSINPFELIGAEWGLVTAGDATGFNTMTVSWGGMGVIWGKNVVTIYVRPQRYTKRFIDATGRFTLRFMPRSTSARSGCLERKAAAMATKLPRWGSRRSSSMTRPHSKRRAWFSCRTLYADDIKPECFLDQSCDSTHYPEHDYHTMYIAEVEHVYRAE